MFWKQLAGGGGAVGVLCEQVTKVVQRRQCWWWWKRGGGGDCMRKIAWLPQTSGPPTAKSKRGGQQDAGGWRWIEFCGETAIAAVLLLQCSTCPLVLWPPQLAWHALLPPVLGMSSLWPFSRCGARLLLWFVGDAGAPLGM